MISNIISGQISAALIRYLGDYVKPRCFDPKTIKTEILKNSITFRNLELKEQVFDAGGTPLKLERGIIGQLKCTWSRNVFFGTEPVTISADKVFLIFRPQNDGSDLERESHRIDKQRQLKAFETARQKERSKATKSASGKKNRRQSRNGTGDAENDSESDDEAGASKKDDDGFFARLLGKLLANLRVNITNVHIRFEDGISTPCDKSTNQRATFAIGAMLKSIKLHSTNSLWQEQIVENTKCFHKVIRVEEFAVYLDPEVTPSGSTGVYLLSRIVSFYDVDDVVQSRVF